MSLAAMGLVKHPVTVKGVDSSAIARAMEWRLTPTWRLVTTFR